MHPTRKRSNAAQISDKEVASELASVNPDVFEDPDVREYLELFATDELSEVRSRTLCARCCSPLTSYQTCSFTLGVRVACVCVCAYAC